MHLPLSLLDRSRTRLDQPDSAALRNTVARARNAEDAGYHRVWVAEHHAVPGIASGVPALMVQAVAQATRRVRVGSGGVMLPNHRPLVVAEQFLTLAALFEGRIDLGVGRSLGFTTPVRDALGVHSADPDEFGADIEALRAFLAGEGPVTARPADPAPPPVFVLGTGVGLQLAARLGLPAVVGGPALWSQTAAFEAYRRDFRPGVHGGEPYLIVSLDILVADTSAQARDLALPEAWAMATSRREGAFPPLGPRSQAPALSGRDAERVEASLSTSIHGTEDEVLTRVTELVARTGADEVMSTGSTYDLAALHESDRRLAEAIRAA